MGMWKGMGGTCFNLSILLLLHTRCGAEKGIAAKQKTKSKDELKEIVFDDNARRDFLTGFNKRNLLKKEAKIARAKEKQRTERLELRRQRRELTERAIRNHEAVESSYRNANKDWGPTSHPQDEQVAFEDEDHFATVTVVQDFNLQEGPVGIALRGPETNRLAPQPENWRRVGFCPLTGPGAGDRVGGECNSETIRGGL
ncbi:hypothetical protein BS47DRAFT_272802 [Hydnum rufescens UP504]|uniref:Nucleolar protein 12 n=1 Tax=Hydnum rufescens UP504 TaxID=1448309 RepID=A0A9P6DQY2_9AGAM|nr:hypothetical protein BS47DRAFT_272802 [Hydnum rufescens UP504]